MPGRPLLYGVEGEGLHTRGDERGGLQQVAPEFTLARRALAGHGRWGDVSWGSLLGC
jgi:hypothetical protein